MPGPSLGVKRVESRWIEGFRANRRLLEVERVSYDGILSDETFSQINGGVERASRLRSADPARTTGLELDRADWSLSRRETEVGFAAASPVEGDGFEPGIVLISGRAHRARMVYRRWRDPKRSSRLASDTAGVELLLQ
jgi:hypothetical protein